METKANYVAVGAFVLACILGLVIALLWLVGAQYSQEFAYYDTHFTGAVTGLSKGTAVRYNGIEVGRVGDLQFDPNDPRVVIATLQVDPKLKLHEDSVASIESQGLAGGSYVEIAGGTQNSPILKARPGEKHPVLKSKPSSLEALFQGTPELIARLNVLSARLNDLVNDQNRAAISGILANLSTTTAVFSKRSAEIDSMLVNLSAASKNVDSAARHLDQLSVDTDHMITGGGPQLIAETRGLIASLTRLSNKLERDPSKIIFSNQHEGYKPQ